MADRHALELSRVDHTRGPSRVLLSNGPFTYVGDNFCFPAWTSHRNPARWQTVLGEALQGPETTDVRLRWLPWVEAVPELLPMALVEVALVGPAQLNHRSGFLCLPGYLGLNP